jgi:uncharacterized protein
VLHFRSRVNPFELIHSHYTPGSELCRILTIHSVLVTQKARKIALDYLDRHPDAEIDMDFLIEAAMLHDIGIKFCHAPEIFCVGTEPYIRHGVLGEALLHAAGFPRHARVCSRHTGAGLTRDDVVTRALPLPAEDFVPVSLEEKIICVADKFFSKKPRKLWKEKKPEAIEKNLSKHGSNALSRWQVLAKEILGD